MELKELHECREVELFLSAEISIPAVMWRDIIKVRHRTCNSLVLDTCSTPTSTRSMVDEVLRSPVFAKYTVREVYPPYPIVLLFPTDAMFFFSWPLLLAYNHVPVGNNEEREDGRWGITKL